MAYIENGLCAEKLYNLPDNKLPALWLFVKILSLILSGMKGKRKNEEKKRNERKMGMIKTSLV